MMSHVLVVDEIAPTQLLTKGVLERQSHLVTTVRDADQALALLCAVESVFDVLVIDTALSDMSGWELTQIVKDTENGWPHLQVILNSFSPSIEEALRAWTLGADHYVGLASLAGVIQKADQIR